MRSVILRSLAVIGAGGLVLAGVLYVASTVDARPPTVLDVRLTQPLVDDDRRAFVTTSLEIVFSELVDADSAAAALSVTPSVSGSVSWSGSTMTFTPSSPLDLDTVYAVTIAAGTLDLAGNAMTDPPSPFEFETIGRPAVAETDPVDGAVDVPIDQPLAITFSTLMDTASVEAQLSVQPGFPHTLRWSGRLLEIVPTEPLRPATAYAVTVRRDATDVAGVPLGAPIAFGFRTVEPGVAPTALVPADGIDGVSTSSPIAIIFDRPIDPDSVSLDLLTVTPAVAGSLDVGRLPDDPASDDDAGSLLVFTPSGALPPNTTFTVELEPGITSADGGELATTTAWSFTTGVPIAEISNQITFISDRGGVANVWAMNSDGSGQRQLTAELIPVIDYAIASNGDSLVVGDGRRLVHVRADGTARRVLTDDDVLEFDPAFSPDGRRVAFARADRDTGEGLGLWEWVVGSGEAEQIVLPAELLPAPSESADELPSPLRAPRYSPDGQALAFVDASGSIGLLQLPSERLTTAAFAATTPPIWLSDSSAVLVGGRPDPVTPGSTVVTGPVAPLAPGALDGVYRLSRSGTRVNSTPFGTGSHVIAVAGGGEIAYVDAAGALWLTDLPTTAPDRPELTGVRVRSGAFGPGGTTLALEIGAEGHDGSIELYDLTTGRRKAIVAAGERPRWVP